MHIHARRGLLAACLTLVLSACGNAGGGGDEAVAHAGSPRSYDRTDSAVTVVPNTNPGFTATQVVTIGNDDAGAARVLARFNNVNGSIQSSAGSTGYQVQVTLTAMAPTEAQAREALATMTVSHRDAVDPGVLYLDNAVNYAKYNANNVSRSAAVAATLPSAPSYQLGQHIINGTASSSGLQGSEVGIDAVNGAVTLSGTWDSAAANSVSSTVTVSGDIADLQASSTNGTVQATLPCLRSTSATLDSSNGTLDATVSRTVGSGFDLYAETTNGTASIVVAGTQAEGSQSGNHAHYRSANYASSSPRVSVAARTINGNALIHE